MSVPFCDGDGFGPITDNHLSTCFQQAVVGIIPVLFLVVCGFMRVVRLSALPRVMSPLTCRLACKGFLSVMMCVHYGHAQLASSPHTARHISHALPAPTPRHHSCGGCTTRCKATPQCMQPHAPHTCCAPYVCPRQHVVCCAVVGGTPCTRYLFPVGFVAIDLAAHRPHAFTVARVVHDVVKSCAWLFSMYILWREFRRAVPNNYVLRGWWVMEFAALVVQFASEPESVTGGSMGVEVLQIANMMCAVGIAIMAFFPKNTHSDSLPLLRNCLLPRDN